MMTCHTVLSYVPCYDASRFQGPGTQYVTLGVSDAHSAHRDTPRTVRDVSSVNANSTFANPLKAARAALSCVSD